MGMNLARQRLNKVPQTETVAPVAETTLPEASVVEGEYTAVM
jgi:hypothetical protein